SMMDSANISRAVISYPTSDAHVNAKEKEITVAKLYNKKTAEVIRHHRDRFIGAAVIPLAEEKEMLDELNRALDVGFKALSMATSYDGVYLDSEKFHPLFERISDAGLPVFVHPTTIKPIGIETVKHPLLTPVIEFIFDTTMCIGKLITSGTLRSFPKLKFVFANFGGATPFVKDRYDSTYNMLLSLGYVHDLGKLPTEFLKQLYVDTSGAVSKTIIQCAIETFDAENILWGSDYPANKNVRASIDAVLDMDISDEKKAGMVGRNAERIFSGVRI
ncbi:MAG: amidohydrolase family protein, partial [Nitrospirae bacterium]|nr:amidohydrolase family protein [Nitrospirota bacterium]